MMIVFAPHATDQQTHIRVVIMSIIGFWIFYFIFNTFRAWLGEADQQLDMATRRAVVAVCGMGLSALLWAVLHQCQRLSTTWLVSIAFIASFPLSLGYAAVNYVAFYVVNPAESTLMEKIKYPEKDHGAWHQIFDSALGWYFFIVAWAILYVALTYALKVRVAERASAAYRAEAQTAQLRALRYQVNPHFLFNTLNSLSSLVLANRMAEAETMILNLSNFFRTSLTADPTEDISLSEEITMQQLYLDIERARFPERLRVKIEVPDALKDARVPGMLLQPLVENAIKYGVSRSTRTVSITIRAFAEPDTLHLVVEDDGDGGVPTTHGHGVGIKNVCDRLAARFGKASACLRGPRPGGGWRVELVMPLSYGS
jgi:two-component system, LytTR family, sensor kinase